MVGVLEGTVNGMPWIYDPTQPQPQPQWLYDAGRAFLYRPQDFQWTCCGEGPLSGGCLLRCDGSSDDEFEDENEDEDEDEEEEQEEQEHDIGRRHAGIEAVINACELQSQGPLSVDDKVFIKELLWYDI